MPNRLMTKPGVQKPHCEAWHCTMACCAGCRRAVLRGQVLDRPQRHAVDRMRQPDAAVDGAKTQRAVLDLAEHDGAGAAVAFAAAFLGAGAAEVFAQQLQNGAPGWYIAQIHHFAPADEAEGPGGGLNNKGVGGHGNQVKTIGLWTACSASYYRLGWQVSTIWRAGMSRHPAWHQACCRPACKARKMPRCRVKGSAIEILLKR